ncbi:MAG: hypothetical protein PHC70_00550 [Patescibacteria group bacterium]|nr:hypothetical protein [Patescibacteria group bacterium]
MNWKILLCLFASVLFTACGGRNDADEELASTDNSPSCIPGAQVSCGCAEGKGTQICKASGHEFYPCECPGVPQDAGHDAIATDAATDSDAQAEAEADALAEADSGAETSTEADAGSDADADALAVETGADADAEAESDALVEAEAEAGTQAILTISGSPGSPTEFVAGTDGAKLHKLQLCTTKKIELFSNELFFQKVSNGARTEGSMGTRYFRTIRLQDGTTTVMGPTELKTGPGETMPQRAQFHGDTVSMDAGTCKILSVVTDIWNVEDAPGELYNQVYQIQDIGLGAIVKAGGDEPVDRPMNSDEYLWTPDTTSANFTILPLQPVLEVKTSLDTPASDIIVAGFDAMYQFSKQDVCNLTDSPVTFAYPTIQQACDGAGGDFTLVDSTFEGTTAHMSSSAFDMFQVAFGMGNPGDSVTLPAKGCLKATLLGKTQPVMPSSSFPGDNTVSRSGHAPCLRLVKFADSNGVQIPTKYTPSDKPNPMVLRKVKPIVTVHNPITPVLYNAEMALHCWQVSVAAASPTDCTAYKQEMFSVETSGMSGVQVCNFKLYRGSTMVDLASFNVTDAVLGTDLKTSCKPASQEHLTVAASLVDEDIICGSGYLYCLRAVTLTTTPGNSVKTKFLSYQPSTVARGQLLNNDSYAPYGGFPNVFNIGELNGQNVWWHVLGDMVWSDQSELPHNSSVLGSKDWTNSYLVQNRDKATILSN